MHGGAAESGAPLGNRNAYKRGRHTREAIAARREHSEPLRQVRATLLNQLNRAKAVVVSGVVLYVHHIQEQLSQ